MNDPFMKLQFFMDNSNGKFFASLVFQNTICNGFFLFEKNFFYFSGNLNRKNAIFAT